ncbi:MAG TPA: 2OG-Fe(II) oxygenase [Caulobacteraceae bacterium]|nr:2OG-Fe(II) oxygenase [Caulobacteraceae bacterium]
MSQPSVQDIHQRALAGDGDARFMLARLFDREGKHDLAVTWLLKAAESGHVLSQTYLGVRFMTGQAAPFAPLKGAGLLLSAAESGNAEAQARAAVLAAAGVGRAQDWGMALDWLKRSARGGFNDAARQLEVLKAESNFRRPGKPLDLAALVAAPPYAVTVPDPRVRVIEKFASPQLCQWIAGRTQGRLAPARVYDADAGGRSQNEMRTNTGAGFGVSTGDVPIWLARARIAEAVNVPMAFLEPVNVLHYDPGQRFELHYDFIDPDVAHFADDLSQRGQRTATALLYLNDDYDGGETAFPNIGHSYKGKTGDLLVFFNVDEQGRPDKRTLHAGTPPTRGEKWVLSQWIRDRSQPVI